MMTAILVLSRRHLKLATSSIGPDSLATTTAAIEVAQSLVRSIAIAGLARGDQILRRIASALRMRSQVIRLPNTTTSGAICLGQLFAAVKAMPATLMKDIGANRI